MDLLGCPVRPLRLDVIRRKLNAQPRNAVDVHGVPVVVRLYRATEQRAPEDALGPQIGGVEYDDLSIDLHAGIVARSTDTAGVVRVPAVEGHRESRVDDYIERLPGWQQEICQHVRDLVHEADPEVEETIKRSVQPYFVLDGNICALLATKDHINVFIYDPTVPDPHGVINQGHSNATAKAVQIYEGDEVDGPALLTLFKTVIANNRAGGWRKLSK